MGISIEVDFGAQNDLESDVCACGVINSEHSMTIAPMDGVPRRTHWGGQRQRAGAVYENLVMQCRWPAQGASELNAASNKQS